ncbi:hypothetical protein B0J13DRAFT_329838 [Dactylonectria estremocensis]|uniref:Uncharacterized protein n=1 Tax=Dactylonectria estremocensis TaxID=1079267 RepID=A0A9P9EV46_9HYPO|nr:hypothetical protein B0J13DRAFT_329838 [Dactylonectria estremocensis]
MCTTLKTTMACGHTFTGTSEQCSPSSSPCSTPDIQYRFLNDTCAKCDPEQRRRRVKLEYECRHAELMQLYLAAKKVGNKDAMTRLEHMMTENTHSTRQRNFEVGLVRRDPDVMWEESSSEINKKIEE